MSFYDQQLTVLSEQVARKKQLDAQIDALRQEERKLEKHVLELDRQRRREEIEVEQLEEGGWKTLLLRMTGKMEQRLSQEQAELVAAQAKYEAAVKGLHQVKAELDHLCTERMPLQGCEQQYEKAYQEKKAALRASVVPQADIMIQAEDEIRRCENILRELKEAISAGQKARQTANTVASSLEDANGLATWDMLGGGFLADMAKHSQLEDAQAQMEQLQRELRKFKTELADVTVEADLKVTVDGFLYVADFFFDGLFADWAVKDEIHKFQSQVNTIREKIHAMLAKLERMKMDTEHRLQTAQHQLQAVVLNTPM